MNREKHFHPLAALHLLRKTLLVYLLPLVQVLFDRNWDALRAALRQELLSEELRNAARTLRQMGITKEDALRLLAQAWEEEET